MNKKKAEELAQTLVQQDEVQQQKKATNIPGALLIISIGIILLLNNFAIIPWQIWKDLWRLWPLVLIFWGLRFISPNAKIVNILIGLISLVILTYLLVVSAASINPSLKTYLQNTIPFITIPAPPISQNSQEEVYEDTDEEKEFPQFEFNTDDF